MTNEMERWKSAGGITMEYGKYSWPFSKMRWISALVVVLCLFINSCSWPWPGIRMNTQGLGQGQIAEYLKIDGWNYGEERLEEKIMSMLAANKSASPRESAEAIGMACETPPSTVCRYSGKLIYQVIRGPRPNTDAAKPHSVVIDVILSDHGNPNSITVKKTVMVVND